MAFRRGSGVLAHPTSFPGPHGIGDLGDAAYHFLDWLASAIQRYWQVMPLGPTGYGDSPYAAASSFAGNPLLISLTRLANEGLIDPDRLEVSSPFPEHEVKFGSVIPFKKAVLREAFDRFRRGAGSDQRAAFETFVAEQAHWLSDFALYMSLKEQFGGRSWLDWDAGVRSRNPEELRQARDGLQSEIRFHSFVQFQFYRQWTDLKRYANDRRIQIIGDIPIFVAHDSADVWSHPELFRLEESGAASVVSGVPPDLFSETGQRWGNPMFAWEEHRQTRFAWWVQRIRSMLSMVDVIRIDHFRGFAAAWTVPGDSPTAAYGRWERGPGRSLFDTIASELGEVPIVVEDLGLITSDVNQLRVEMGLPGMRVLQFAFNGDPNNVYLPHNFDRDSVVYTGTHDNQTTVGWFQSLDERTRRQVQTYLGRDGSDIAWDFIRLALSSIADVAIMPLQDVMRLGDEARMNKPGSSTGNWDWRYLPHQLHAGIGAGLAELTSSYGRSGILREQTIFDPYDYTAPEATHRLW